MSIFDTFSPPQTRCSKPTANGSGSRSRTRRIRQPQAFAAEALERRLALAVTFNPRFSVDAPGDITIAANTLMTAFVNQPGTAAQVVDAQNGTGSNPSVWNDDFWNMQFVGSDGTVANSSSAVLALPTGADVLFAGLYYGARTNTGVADATLKTVKFKGPGDASYVSLTGAAGPNQVLLLGRVNGGVSNLPANVSSYGAFADVTDLVQARGQGSYTIANVTGDTGSNRFAGWSLVVAYEAPGANLRNLTVFDGFADVSEENPNVEVDISGFTAPPSGPVKANLGFVSYEGDLGISGDTASFDGGLGSTTLFNATNPANNFFNSSISTNGVTVTSKSPNYKNQLGFDADILNIDGLIANGATQAKLTLTSTQDQYYPGVVTGAIDLYAPKVTVTKSVVDLNGGIVEPGDTLRYTITVANDPTAFDTAANVILNDAIPAFTTYKPGSLSIIDVGSVTPTAKTDAIDADQAEALPSGGVPPTSAVRFQLGTDAGGGTSPAGGKLVKGASTTATFDVTVNSEFPSEGLISNTAVVSYTSQFTGVPFTANATATIQCPPIADVKIEKTDSPATSYVPGQATTYTITVSNLGPAAVPASFITDTLPADTSFDPSENPGWTLTAGVLSRPTSPLVAGAFQLYTLKLKPASDRVGDLVNTATIAVPPGYWDPDRSNNTSTDTSPCTPQVNLSVTKTDGVGVTTYVPGKPVTYTIFVTNSGPSDLVDGSVFDALPAIATSGSWTASGSSGTSFTPRGNPNNVDAAVNIPAGGSLTFLYTVQTRSDATENLFNLVTVTPPEGQGSSTTATDTDTPTPQVTLTVTKDDGTDRYRPGTSTTYEIIVTNVGPSFLKGGLVQDLLPTPQAGSGSWTATTMGDGSSVTPAFGGKDIIATVDLPVGGTAKFFYTVNILSTATGELVNTVTVSPPPGTTGNTATAIDRNFPPEPPLSVFGGLVIGSDDGCNGLPYVRVLDPNDGTTVVEFLAYESSFRGSVRVATGDVNGDGVEDILVAPGRNRVGEIRVFTQLGLELTAYRTIPFGPRYRGGVEVTAADINGDGVKDIVAGMSSGAGMVSGFLVTPAALDPVGNAPVFSFRGFPPPYAGGVMLAAGDFGTYSNGQLTSPALDLRDEIVVGSNSGRRATVNVWEVSGAPRIVRTILPFGAKFKGGVTLSVAKYDAADNVQDIIVGAGIGGGSAVAIFSGATGGLITRLPPAAFGSFSKPNAAVFTAAVDLTGDGPVTNVYGVQGRNGGRGTSGVFGYTRSSGVTSLLSQSTGNLPPLRIAPLKVRLL